MKFLVFIFTIFFSNNIFSQNFKPFLQTPYENRTIDLITLNDGQLVSLNILPGIVYNSSGNDYLEPFEVNYYPLTAIQVYDIDGNETQSFSLPYSDSTVFWAANMILLEDGRLCVGGDFVNVKTGFHNIFFAIINEDLNNFETIEILEETLHQTTTFIKENSNGNIIFFQGATYKEFNLNGFFMHLYNIPTAIAQNSYFSLHPYNNNIYSFYGNDSIKYLKIAQTTNFTLKKNTDSINYPFHSSLFGFSSRGIILEDNTYIINSIVYNYIDSISNINILRIDEQGDITPFFRDSIGNNVSFHRLATSIDYYDKDYIYVIYTIYNGFGLAKEQLVYCLTKNGVLRWKKIIKLNNNLTVSLNKGFVTAMAATKDKGVIFTIDVDDSYGNADVYYCKLDSLGNPIDFNTNIQKIDVSINDFLLYPNPSRQFLNIKTSLQQKYTIVLYNINGKQVLQEKIKNGSQVNISQFTKGVYFYSITDTNNKEIQKGKFVMK